MRKIKVSAVLIMILLAVGFFSATISKDQTKIYKEKTLQYIPQEVLKSNDFKYGFESMKNPKEFRYFNEKEVRIAVLDSGVDKSHPLIKKHLLTGVNVIEHNKPPTDYFEHGTHIAGIILNNVPPSIKVIPIKVIDDNGHGKINNLIKGIKLSIDKKVDIINTSLVVKNPDKRLKFWIEKAYQMGIVIVAPTGNAGSGNLSYPANYKDVIAVGSYNNKEKISEFSQYGKNIDFVAPGENIGSSTPLNGYKRISGTSQATAFVTRAIALYMITNKFENNEELFKDLILSADNIMGNRYNYKSGYGKINLQKLVRNWFV